MTRVQRMLALLRPVPDGRPLVEQAPTMTLVTVLRRFAPQLRPLRGWMMLILLLMAAAPAVELGEILLFERLVDDVLVPADLGPLLTLALLYVGLNVVSAVVSGLDDYLSTWVSQKFLVRLRTDVFRHVLALPSHVHDRRRLGDTMSRITSDVSTVESFMIGQLSEGVGAAIRLTFFVTALFVMQWDLALASLVVVPLFWWVTTHFSRFVKEVSRERRRRAGSLSSVTEESLGNSSLVQSYNREDDAVSAYHRQNLAIASAELAASRIRAVFLPLADLAELVGTLAVIWLGTWALATDRLTLGGLLAFLALLAQCYRPVRDLSDLLPSLYSATAGIERIVELLDEPVPTDRPGARPLPGGRGAVAFSDVILRYPGATTDALRGLDLSIEAGEVLGLVGPSGAGKSTIVRLITRQLDPTTGTVRIDGHDVGDATATSVREAVTVVSQETLLLDASVAENIAFARPDASRTDVEAAARAADAHEFIQGLPDGYDTRIGQRGRSLSGGQRQRLALARALLRNPAVLILDEPTTGLDAPTARRVLEPVLRAMSGRTVILATHDPVALEYVDRVALLEQGRVVTGVPS